MMSVFLSLPGVALVRELMVLAVCQGGRALWCRERFDRAWSVDLRIRVSRRLEQD